MAKSSQPLTGFHCTQPFTKIKSVLQLKFHNDHLQVQFGTNPTEDWCREGKLCDLEKFLQFFSKTVSVQVWFEYNQFFLQKPSKDMVIYFC